VLIEIFGEFKLYYTHNTKKGFFLQWTCNRCLIEFHQVNFSKYPSSFRCVDRDFRGLNLHYKHNNKKGFFLQWTGNRCLIKIHKVNSSKYPCFFRCVDRDLWGVEAVLHTQQSIDVLLKSKQFFCIWKMNVVPSSNAFYCRIWTDDVHESTAWQEMQMLS
jgi:hypothetical protein